MRARATCRTDRLILNVRDRQHPQWTPRKQSKSDASNERNNLYLVYLNIAEPMSHVAEGVVVKEVRQRLELKLILSRPYRKH